MTGINPGQTLPTRESLGLWPKAEYKPFNAPTTQVLTLQPGQVIENALIYGDISLLGGLEDAYLNNCWLAGGNHKPTRDTSVVDLASTRAGTNKLKMNAITMSPQVPNIRRDGIRGHRWELRNFYIEHTVDGLVPYAFQRNQDGDAMVVFETGIVTAQAFFYPDTVTLSHTGGTHNDALALNGGHNIRGTGVLLDQVIWPGPGTTKSRPQDQSWNTDGQPYYASGASMFITTTTDVPLDNSVVMDSMWLSGGLAQMNVKANTTMITRNIRFSQKTAYQDSKYHKGYWFRADVNRTAKIGGLGSMTWYDGPNQGQALTEANRGLIWDS